MTVLHKASSLRSVRNCSLDAKMGICNSLNFMVARPIVRFHKVITELPRMGGPPSVLQAVQCNAVRAKELLMAGTLRNPNATEASDAAPCCSSTGDLCLGGPSNRLSSILHHCSWKLVALWICWIELCFSGVSCCPQYAQDKQKRT